MITVVGIGEDGLDGLSPAARTVIDNAEVLVGGSRHLGMVPANGAKRLEWASPFADSRALLEPHADKRLVVLASGEPLWFGAAATLTGWFGADSISVIPHPGAFSLAAARLGWAMQDCLFLTIHGRPIESLVLHLAPGRRLLILAEDRASPAKVAALLAANGYGPSRVVVLENLGGPNERVTDAQGCASDLCVVAVECVAERGVRLLSAAPGLPDEAFEHDGQLTKRDIRAATLAALAPVPGQVLWDVGAGSGSIAIEWMRAGGRAIAMESKPDRLERIARNAARLGVPGLEIIAGRAPDALPLDRDPPDAVFVGGGVSEAGLLDICWSALGRGGRLVANAVTMEGEEALVALYGLHGGEMTRLSVSHLDRVGGFHAWHPAKPVTRYVGWKK
ncbi:Precorrin-6Y C(5,15)-methyltransferase [decarboxylating]（Cobalamin (vitamin B12) biosynthesis CbiE, precorrin-6Y methyltransferase, core,4-183；Cobalamin biosynthesis, precorrin-6Y methyltransferase, CbiT subunit,222-342&|uniref:bifunctional cobalt-precorrin-7 (C(5))-methyltransferase/cobalt-precorrin-6B (C(15))-methyltransferase n=1 Tax=Magnetospirillum sp. XM-1 TaxID=1663591 RepID=UPI00073DBC4F|nr:bifunctional cobalt-precorrin-7 (C(5))-methyltransferase/cobalt-precorrin-6B (C(15))-methyltransferase [Magnetospirillum sp. XM-1]CUW38294.1 Precorrin-6Y C(5,15)-methyltransferase [decarboxylating]\